MKNWWTQLSLREKKTIGIGCIFLLVILLYMGIWIPWQEKMATMRLKVKSNHELIAWMRQVDQKIQSYQPLTPRQTSGNASLLSETESALKASVIHEALMVVHQEQNNAIKLNFKEVDFDIFISWLINYATTNNLIIQDISVSLSSLPGKVMVTLLLKKST